MLASQAALRAREIHLGRRFLRKPMARRLPPTVDTMAAIRSVVCELYHPCTKISTVKELRWLFFRKSHAQSERLIPTFKKPLWEQIFRELVWHLDTVAASYLPSVEFGWKEEGDQWLPVMTHLLPAPEAIIVLIKCSGNKSRYRCATNRCNCSKAKLNCTDLYGPSDSREPRSNKTEDDT